MPNNDLYARQDIFAPKRRRKAGFFVWSLISLAAGGLLIGFLYLVFYSPALKVQAMSVSGVNLLSPADLWGALSTELAGRNKFLALLGPDNILFWVLGGKPESLASAPQLGNLEIQTDLFKRQVTVSAEERKLVGVLCESGQNCYGFDKDGVIFARVPQAQGALILRIDDQNQRLVSLGDKILGNDGWIKNVFDVLGVLKGNSLHIASVALRPLSLKEWQVGLAAGPVFYFGLDHVPAEFDGIMKNLLKRLNLAKLNYLDFRVENRIYYK